MNMNKISATAGKLERLFAVLQKIVQVCMIVVFCVVAVLTVANLVNPEVVIGTGLNELDLGPITLVLHETLTPDNGHILAYVWIYCLVGLADGVCLWLGMGCLRQILARVSQGSPFAADTAGQIKKLAWIWLARGIIDNLGSLAEAPAILRTFPFDALISAGTIRAVYANYTLDLTFLPVFLLLLVLSWIFAYGAQLQQQSDETL